MNKLQEFMARGNVLARSVVQEPVELNGAVYFGTFGDPQVLPVMTRHGHEDHLVTELKISTVQFADKPAARQTLRRALNNREFFIQAVDTTHPVVFTFILTDREL